MEVAAVRPKPTATAAAFGTDWTRRFKGCGGSGCKGRARTAD